MKNKHRNTMPAEWEYHERTIIEWPIYDSLVWPENHAEVIESYSEVINAIIRFEPVTVIVTEETIQEARALCNEKVEFVTIPHNDAWARDNGPTFVWDEYGLVKGVNWKFNAWGNKYSPFDLDDEMANVLLDILKVPSIQVPIVLEGGSIHVDGEGTLLSTKECLLNPNRNPKLSQSEIEEIVKEELNISVFIWLNNGLYGDETDGHVDNIACFAKPGVVLIQTCYDKENPNYSITKDSLDILSRAKDAQGRQISIIEIPSPPARYYKGKSLTLSYLNFYLVNGGLILPVFGGDAIESDGKAYEVLQKVYPDRKIIKINGMGLIKEGGNVHCITQQMPSPRKV